MSMTCWCVEGWTFDILRNWNKYVHIVGDASLFVVALDFYDESDSVA